MSLLHEQRRLAQRSPQPIDDARLRYLASRFHRLGERAIYLLLNDAARGVDPIEAAEGFATLDPEYVIASGLDKFERPRVVAGGRR